MISQISRALTKATLGTMFAFAASVMTANAEGWPAEKSDGWDALIEAAKGEAPLVIMAIDPKMESILIPAFTADTGIEAHFIAGGRREGPARFNREVRAGKVSFDIFFSGPSPLAMRGQSLIKPLSELLVLPEVLDETLWHGGKLPYVDEEQTLTSPSNYMSGLVLVNTDLTDPSDLKHWNDLFSDEFKGKIAMHDPTIRGAGLALAANLLDELGPEYVAQLLDAVNVVGDYRQVTDFVARGSHLVGLGALPRHIAHYKAQGVENLVVISLEGAPGYTVGGSSVMTVPEKAPSPNAAAVFANWFHSKNGQTVYSEVHKSPSARIDVTERTWPEYLEPWKYPGAIDQYEGSYYLHKRNELQKQVKAILEN